MFKSLILIVLCMTLSVMCKIELTRKKLKEITGEHIYDPEYEFDSMQIVSIASDAFTDIRKTVVHLDLSYNEFKSLPSNVFQGLEKLKVLNLGSNKLKTIDSNLFVGLRSLEDLKLKRCELKTIDQNTFKGLSNLHSLDISLNYISRIHEKTFSDLRNLEELDAQYNKIEEINANHFSNNKKLKELTLDNNQIKSLDVNAINKLCLEKLTLQGNNKKFDVRKENKCMVVSGIADDKSGSGGSGTATAGNSAAEVKAYNLLLGSSVFVFARIYL